MKILRKKTLRKICQKEIENALLFAESFAHGEMSYEAYYFGVRNSMKIIETVGTKDLADECYSQYLKEVESRNKEINFRRFENEE